MSYISNIVRVLSVLLLHFVCSFTQQTKIGEAQTSFTSLMFPYFDDYRAINSSDIAVNWYPSPNIANVSLTQLYGTLTIAAYAGYRSFTYSTILVYPLTKLNETGKIVITGLQADTIYSVRVHPEWKYGGQSISKGSFTKLVRTYPTSK